jgi:2-polyprenyl-3-methyl-5-hydroxy-6-metoxy-1,4-benzoquinol methylase
MSVQHRTWQDRYLEQFYRNRKDWTDGTTQFHELIKKHLPAEKEILELGPGPQNRTSDFLARNYAWVDGLDVDADAQRNPALRQLYLCTDEKPWPVASARYDAVVANYVLEHLPSPTSTAAEAHRVLRPGGLFIFRTPNLLHYVSMVSWLSPHWFHIAASNRLRRRPPGTHDPYPTFYRMNRPRTIMNIMRRVGFENVESFTIEKEPSYGMSSRCLFLLFMAYERCVNSTPLAAPFRANILGVFAKPPARQGAA